MGAKSWLSSEDLNLGMSRIFSMHAVLVKENWVCSCPPTIFIGSDRSFLEFMMSHYRSRWKSLRFSLGSRIVTPNCYYVINATFNSQNAWTSRNKLTNTSINDAM